MNLDLPLTWNEGVYLMPVADLPEELRQQLEPEEGDFALTRPQGRSGSKILGREAAELLRRFRQPHTLAEAVLLYSRLSNAEPHEVLADSFPLIRSLVTEGFLLPLQDGTPVPVGGTPLESGWQRGEALLGGVVEKVLQVLEDSEIHLLRRTDPEGPAEFRVVKAARLQGGEVPTHVRQGLAHEAEALRALEGAPVPRLFAEEEVDGRPCLEIEHVAGVELDLELDRIQRRGGSRAGRLALALATVDAYVAVHGREWLHGDVHPRNVLVKRDGGVSLIDFGLAGAIGGGHRGPRGGIPFFYEPELARAYLDGTPPPAATVAGEQYALGVLVYYVLTGAYPRDYSLGREEMLAEILEQAPLPFEARGVDAWPAVEAVLARCMAKDPADRFPSIADLAVALRRASAETGDAAAGVTSSTAASATVAARRRTGPGSGGDLLSRCLESAGPGGDWLDGGSLAAPTASVNYGSAGVALGLFHAARALGDGGLFGLADVWHDRARRSVGEEAGFYDPEIEITAETVGRSSPYHSPTGVHAVAALLARGRGDAAKYRRATTEFISACGEPAAGLDLTLGLSSHLVGAAILLDAAPPDGPSESDELAAFGDGVMEELWSRLDGEPAIRASGIDYLGVAHGWAGFLYATLTWCAVRGAPVPPGVGRRLDELADFATPAGRGLTWPWTLRGEGRSAVMPGWCNGSCGYVFLWALAHRWSGRRHHLELAVGAAWDAWDAPDRAVSLCCGLAGRAYALLCMYRLTADPAWLDKARALVEMGAGEECREPERAHCLYKGELGLAVTAADLERPEAARMPLFEPAGYRAPAF